MIIYGIALHNITTKQLDELVSYEANTDNGIELHLHFSQVENPKPTCGVFGFVLDNRSAMGNPISLDTMWNDGPTANQVMALIRASDKLKLNDKNPQLWVFEQTNKYEVT